MIDQDNRSVDGAEAIADFRRQIDGIDARLVHLLAERFRITREVGRFKALKQLPPRDPGREGALLDAVSAMAREQGLQPEIARAVMRLILDEVVRQHHALRTETEQRP